MVSNFDKRELIMLIIRDRHAHTQLHFEFYIYHTSHTYISESVVLCSHRACVLYLPVVDYFHCTILFYPKFAQDDIVYTAVRVAPCVCLIEPGTEEERKK